MGHDGVCCSHVDKDIEVHDIKHERSGSWLCKTENPTAEHSKSNARRRKIAADVPKVKTKFAEANRCVKSRKAVPSWVNLENMAKVEGDRDNTNYQDKPR